MFALTEYIPAKAPPCPKAELDVKLTVSMVTLSPCKRIAPPSPNDLHNVNEALEIVKLSDSIPTYTAPPFGATQLVKFAFSIVPLLPNQSIAPPRPPIVEVMKSLVKTESYTLQSALSEFAKIAPPLKSAVLFSKV